MAAVDKAARVQREVRDTLQKFEGTRARIKDIRTQRIRTKRAWAIKTAEERRFLRDNSGRQMQSPGRNEKKSHVIVMDLRSLVLKH